MKPQNWFWFVKTEFLIQFSEKVTNLMCMWESLLDMDRNLQAKKEGAMLDHDIQEFETLSGTDSYFHYRYIDHTI